MDLQTRKLSLIEYILKIDDNKSFTALEDAINDVAKSSGLALKQFTKDELISRAEESNANYISGKVITQDKLEDEAKNW